MLLTIKKLCFFSCQGKKILFFLYAVKKEAAISLMRIKSFIPGGDAYCLAKILIKFQNAWSYIFISPTHLDFLEYIC